MVSSPLFGSPRASSRGRLAPDGKSVGVGHYEDPEAFRGPVFDVVRTRSDAADDVEFLARGENGLDRLLDFDLVTAVRPPEVPRSGEDDVDAFGRYDLPG